MSIGSLALSAAQIARLNKAVIRPIRSIGGLMAHVTIKERHIDQLEVTSHPVERGSVVTDHAFKKPVMVTIECGWSNSPPAQSYVTLTASPRQVTVQEVYEELQTMQNNRDLIEVITGKRKYANMLIVSLEVETDKDGENALHVMVTLQELILVGTQIVTLGASTDSSKQLQPAITAPTINAGTKQLQSAPLYNPQAGP